ncbi:chaplin [Kitasatospora herbaricolor]|uniref:chaplin n=1 Tax=Kitasatospora herbaricolor TaxID=68217 RepID=UPI002E32A0A0|nr:chaplin [Kitasatospora herbaricolor]
MRNVAKKGLLTAVATGSVLASTAGYAYASAEAHGGAVNSPGVGSGNSVQVPVDVPVNACGNTVDVIGLLNPAYGNRCANADAGTHGQAAHSASEPGRSAAAGTPGQSAPAHAAPAKPAPAHAEPAHPSGQRPGGHDASGISGGGASASGTTAGSPGVLSGNSAAVPVSIPVNACGNSANVVGAANPAFGNACGNVSVPTPPVTTEEECPPEETGSTPPKETPGTPRAGGPAEAPPVIQAVAPAAPVVPAQATAPQLASTGAGGVEMLGAAGLAALLGGGVLYRRARAGVR